MPQGSPAGQRCQESLAILRHPVTVPEALADPRLRRYPLRRLRLPMAGGQLSIVTVDAASWRRRGGGVDRILRGEEPPYWADVWPASLAAARILGRHGSLVGSKVFDLGCGIGVAGAAAARCGAEVWFGDREPDALAFALFNGTHNCEPGARVHDLPFDWSRDDPPAAMDLWLLCDLSYRPRYHDSLLRQLTTGLGHGALAIHCDPMRVESESFLRRVAQTFAVHTVTVPLTAEGQTGRMRITLIARQAGTLASWLPHLQPRRRASPGELSA